MRDIVFALISPSPEQADSNSGKLRELTIAWSRYGYHGQLIEDHTIDQALARAARTGARHCLLQSVGHVIDEQWYLSHWRCEGFYRGLQRLAAAGNFLVVGESFISEQGSAGLKTDCLLIDLHRYLALGEPAFGAADLAPHARQPVPAQAAATAAHITNAAGWHFIELSRQQGLALTGFGPGVNNCRFDLAATVGATSGNAFSAMVGRPVADVEACGALTPAQATFVGRIRQQLSDAKKGVFLFNIESYDDLARAQGREPLDAVFSVAAGFKPYRILLTQDFHSATKVVLFDYSAEALAVRRHIVEHWDGDDFPRFVRGLFQRFPHPDVFYQLWHGVTPDTLDWHDMEQLWQQELLKWGGAASFKQHWQRCRHLPHQYLHCDLLQDRGALLDELRRHRHAYIWWSNAFFTIFSHWHYSAAERKEQYLEWITELAAAAPECQVNGADHNNIAVNGLTAARYAEQFNRQRDDALDPQRLHEFAIKF